MAELSAKYPQYASLIRAYHEHWEESIGEPLTGTIEIVRKLKGAGYLVYGLSNWSAETFPITRRKHDFFDLFDGFIISGEVNLVKPDPAIFNLLLQRIGGEAHECLLIDDAPANVEAAQKLGFQTILFTSPDQLQIELQKFNILL